MVTTHQEFTFADATSANLPGLIFSSRYASLSAAVTDAVGLDGILVIDQDWPSVGTLSIGCDLMEGGGIIGCTNGSTITVSGRVMGNGQIFDVTAWIGDPTLTGGTPTNPFPVLLTQCTNVNAAWFGACVAAPGADTRLALQATFCSIGAGGTAGETASILIPAGYTYAFDRNTYYDPASPLPYGILIPEQRIIHVNAEGARFDYQGSEYESSPPTPSGLGTCAFAWYSNQPGGTYWYASLIWEGGLVIPSAVGTNSDFLWLNNLGSRCAVRNLQVGSVDSVPPQPIISHRSGIVQCQWDPSQAFTGQRMVIDHCDVSQCTDTGIIICQCDGLLISACRVRVNQGSGIELGCDGQRYYNAVKQSGTCSSPKVLAGNYEGNVKSGIKCIDVRDAYISADFEANAVGLTNSDANMDFSGLFDLEAGTGNSTSGSAMLTGLSFNPLTRGWAVGMYVKDTLNKITGNSTITAVTSTVITLSHNVTTTNTGLVLSAFSGTGDREGVAEACTWSNSNSGGNAINVITQASTVLKNNLHKGATPQEIGVLHLSTTQPLWATKEIFSGSMIPTLAFSTSCWVGGVITRESAVSCMLPPGTMIANGTTPATGVQLTPFFSLDGQSIMVEAGGLASTTTGFSTNYRLQLFDSVGTLIQTLTAGTALWEEGKYQNQLVGARLAMLTQTSVSGWSTGKTYAIYAMNLTSGAPSSAALDGGVIIRYCPIIPT
jgi:hypothetical protein